MNRNKGARIRIVRYCSLIICLLGLLPGISKGASVSLAWDASTDSDISGYNLYRSDFSGIGFSKINNQLIAELTYVDQTAQLGKTYFYVATAVNEAGLESGFSEEVSVDLTGAGNPPSAAPDSVVITGSQVVSIAVTANDSDPDGDPLTITDVTPPLQGSAFIQDQLIQYTPPTSYEGFDSFSYVVTDGNGNFSQAEVSIQVFWADYPPTARDDGVATGQGVATRINVLRNDSDLNGDRLTIVDLGETVNADLALNEDDTIRYAPKPDFSGLDTFTYSVTDGNSTAEANVDVFVRALKVGLDTLVFPSRIEPHRVISGQPFVSVALLNAENSASSVIFHAFDADGVRLGSSKLEDPLPPGGQTALISQEASPFAKHSSTLVVEGAYEEIAESVVAHLEGFFMVGDSGRLDGVGAQLGNANQLYFPVIRQSGSEITMVYLVNQDQEKEAALELLLYDVDGNFLHDFAAVIPPVGSLSSTLPELFGADLTLEEGFLRVNSDIPVRGFSLVSNEQTFMTLQGQAPSKAMTLVAPHFVVNNSGSSSTLRVLVNPALPTTVKVRAFDNNSNLLAEKQFDTWNDRLLVIGLEQVLEIDPSSLAEPLTGFVEISTVNSLQYPESAIGTISFSGEEDRAATLMPLISEGGTLTIFPHLAQSKGEIFTGLSILNRNQIAANVTVESFDHSGNLTAQTTFELPPNGRRVDLLDGSGFFGADFEQVKGYIRVLSNYPVTAFAIFGDYGGEALSAIEGQILLP